jgi:glycosyltransferase involved in cell wall biosynthesis
MTLEENAGKLSVCHIASGDSWAGAEAQVASTVRMLARRSDISLSAIVLNEGRLASEMRQAGVAVKVIPEDRYGFLKIVTEASGFIREQEVNLLHSHRYKENCIAQSLALCCGVGAVVRTQHGMPEPFVGWRGVRHSLTQRFDSWSGRHLAGAIISVSSEMAPLLARRYGEDKVFTIRNGIDTAGIASPLSREEAKCRLGCGQKPLIGIVGRLEPIKRVDLFLEVVHELTLRVPDIEFVVAGDGSLRESLIACACHKGLEARVHFLGYRKDIHDVLRALDVLVMCSDHEGLPMVLLEALWLGVPVVGRAVGGIREVLGENRNGLCVDSSDAEALAAACERLLRDPLLGEDLCRSARQAIEGDFSAEGNAAAVAELYRRLTG